MRAIRGGRAMAPFGRWDSRSGRREHSTAAGRPHTRAAPTRRGAAARCPAGEMWHPSTRSGRRRDCQDDRLRRRPRSHGGPPGPAVGRDPLPDHRRDARRSRARTSCRRRCGRSPTSASTCRWRRAGCCSTRGSSPSCSTRSIVGPERPRARRRLRPRLLGRGARAHGRGGRRARGRPGDGARGRGAARGARRSTTPWSRPGRSPAGVPEHGPFDAILIEGAIEVLPDGARRPAEARRADRGDLRRGRQRPGAARAAGPTPASSGGVSSMQRRRCCPASRRRKHLSFEPMRPIVPAEARATGRSARAAPGIS